MIKKSQGFEASMRELFESTNKTMALIRIAFFGLAAAVSLSACTTVEGTNAMVDPLTFEREVMRTTLQGVGIVPQEEKPMVSGERSPLVLPASGSTPPPPTRSPGSNYQTSTKLRSSTQTGCTTG